MLDLRNIGRPAIDSRAHLGTAQLNVTYICETKYGPGDDDYLLGDESVEEFIWEFLRGEFELTASNHDALDRLEYTFEVEHGDTAVETRDAVRNRIDHILSCITWDTCPVCRKWSRWSGLRFRFINPDHLDHIWEEQSFNCISGCDDYTRSEATIYRKQHELGFMEDHELECRLTCLELLSTESDLNDLKYMDSYLVLLQFMEDKNLGIPEANPG